MKKQNVAKVFGAAMAVSMLAGISAQAETLNLYAFTDEVPKMVEKYIELHPDCGIELNSTIIATTDGAYQPALDQALMAGGEEAPDIYVAEAAFVLKYSQGDAAGFAMPYEDLGIDVDAALEEAQIAQYSAEIGTNPDGDLVALGYQATGGAFIYRRSVAQAAFGYSGLAGCLVRRYEG